MPEITEGSCQLLPRIEAQEAEVLHNKNAHKEIYSRLEVSSTASAVFDEKLRQIKDDTQEIKATVQEMKERPGKRWDGLVEKALWAVCAAVIAFMLGRLGL